MNSFQSNCVYLINETLPEFSRKHLEHIVHKATIAILCG